MEDRFHPQYYSAANVDTGLLKLAHHRNQKRTVVEASGAMMGSRKRDLIVELRCRISKRP